jgi:hypothetical protein
MLKLFIDTIVKNVHRQVTILEIVGFSKDNKLPR